MKTWKAKTIFILILSIILCLYSGYDAFVSIFNYIDKGITINLSVIVSIIILVMCFIMPIFICILSAKVLAKESKDKKATSLLSLFLMLLLWFYFLLRLEVLYEDISNLLSLLNTYEAVESSEVLKLLTALTVSFILSIVKGYLASLGVKNYKQLRFKENNNNEEVKEKPKKTNVKVKGKENVE